MSGNPTNSINSTIFGNGVNSTNSTNSTCFGNGVNSTNSTNSTCFGNGINITIVSPVDAVYAAEKAALAAEEKIYQYFADLQKYAREIWAQVVELWTKYHYYIIRYGGIAIGALVFLIFMCCCCIRCCKRKPKKSTEKVKLKASKPKKKLKRLQPNRIEKQVMKDLGTMTFSVRYDRLKTANGENANELVVIIEESENIPVHDISGYAYSFVVVKLLPLHDEMNDETEYKTNHARARSYPVYGDILRFKIGKDQLNKQTLYLYQYELNSSSTHDGIGQIAYELKKANLLKEKTGEVRLTKKLSPLDPLFNLEVETGAVFMNIDYDSNEWTLKVQVLQADIIPQEEGENPTTYISLAFINMDGRVFEKHKTRKSKVKGLKPKFEESGPLEFDVPDTLMLNLRMLLKIKESHFPYLKKASLIGKSVLECSSNNMIIANLWRQLIEEDSTSGWFPVHTKPKKK